MNALRLPACRARLRAWLTRKFMQPQSVTLLSLDAEEVGRRLRSQSIAGK